VYNDYTAVTTITNSMFYSNKAASGAAIASQGQLSLKDCVIDSNTASLIGGGLYMISAAIATNSNDTADVVYTNVTITGTSITNNKCTERAGGLYIDDYVSAIISKARIKHHLSVYTYCLLAISVHYDRPELFSVH
jgi:phosphoserine aminotransferase